MYLITALVPSDTACLANSPGRRRRTAVWISREVMVDLNISKKYNQQQSTLKLPLVVVCQLASLSSDPLEQVIDERVHDGHGLRGDTSVWMNLLQDLQHIDAKIADTNNSTL